DERRQYRMRPGAMRREISGRAEEHAELVNVGDGSGNQHAHNNRPASAWKECTSQREGRERVSGDIHGQREADCPLAARASCGTSNLSALGTIENSTGRRT